MKKYSPTGLALFFNINFEHFTIKVYKSGGVSKPTHALLRTSCLSGNTLVISAYHIILTIGNPMQGRC